MPRSPHFGHALSGGGELLPSGSELFLCTQPAAGSARDLGHKCPPAKLWWLSPADGNAATERDFKGLSNTNNKVVGGEDYPSYAVREQRQQEINDFQSADLSPGPSPVPSPQAQTSLPS